MSPWLWSFSLLGLGALLVVLEFFVPSAGVIGITAAICLVAAVVVGFLDSMTTGTIVLAIEVLGIPIILTAMVRVWPHTPIGRRLFLRPPDEQEVTAYKERESALQRLVGQRGVAKSPMMPSGMVTIERRHYDAVAEGEAVEVGEPIVVRTVRMNRLIVRKVRPDLVPPPATEPADLLSRSIEELGLGGIDDDRT